MGFMKIPVKVNRLAGYQGELPQYQTSGSSGFDVKAQISETLVLESGMSVLVPTGLAFEIPQGYEIQARPRSGLAAKHGVTVLNSPGTIDSDYRGEVKIILINHGRERFSIAPGERVAQLVLAPVVQALFLEQSQLAETERGAGGFGSTGRN